MNPRPYILAETNLKSVRAAKHDLAVLPWGAVEAHNLHLPYATDVLQVDAVAAEAARLAWEAGARPIVLPAVPYGVNTGQLDIPLTINMNPSTQLAVLGDIVQSLSTQGFNKLVVFNGHGGNDFRQIIRELIPRFPDFFICTLNWWQVVDAEQYFEEPGNHAGQMETSILLDIRPDWVRPLSEAGSGHARRMTVPGLNSGWAWAQRAWTRVTDDTGVGNPQGSTAEAGRRFLDALVSEIARFLVDLSQTDNADLYEKD